MDSLGTIAFGAACAAAGSLATGYLLKTAEQRRELRDAGRLEVGRKRQLDLYETVRSLSGQLAELQHCVEHVMRDRDLRVAQAYAAKGADLRLGIREKARAEILGVGPEIVLEVKDTTDRAERIFKAIQAERVALAEEMLRAEAHDCLHELRDLRNRLEVLQAEREVRWRR